jgi:hypothetical protein
MALPTNTEITFKAINLALGLLAIVGPLVSIILFLAKRDLKRATAYDAKFESIITKKFKELKTDIKEDLNFIRIYVDDVNEMVKDVRSKAGDSMQVATNTHIELEALARQVDSSLKNLETTSTIYFEELEKDIKELKADLVRDIEKIENTCEKKKHIQ